MQAPWRLTQLYVQESVFEDFKEALEGKARSTGSNLVVGNKTFLIECLESGQCGIPIHAYRTTKELLTFIKTPYLSVWAAESALSHEIALRSASSTIWVNDYGSFEGPCRSALSIYNLTKKIKFYSTVIENIKTENLVTWTKLSRIERFKIIDAALKVASRNVHEIKAMHDFQKLRSSHNDNIVQVTEKTVCIGLQKSGVDFGYTDSLFCALKVLLLGNAVFICKNDLTSDIIYQLQNNGVPIYSSGDVNNSLVDVRRGSYIHVHLILERLKVIRSNYGTIFAN